MHMDLHYFLRLNILTNIPHMKAAPSRVLADKKSKPSHRAHGNVAVWVMACKKTPRDSFGLSVLSNNANI